MSLKKLMATLPEEVIINNILPFTYSPQPPRLMRDILSYHNEKQFLENIYYMEFNENILIYDLLRYCNRDDPGENSNAIFENILRRNYVLSRCPSEYVIRYRLNVFVNSFTRNSGWKIKFIWGLLKPREREYFINRALFNSQEPGFPASHYFY